MLGLPQIHMLQFDPYCCRTERWDGDDQVMGTLMNIHAEHGMKTFEVGVGVTGVGGL